RDGVHPGGAGRTHRLEWQGVSLPIGLAAGIFIFRWVSAPGHRPGDSPSLYRPLRSEFQSQYSSIREAAVMARQSRPRSISLRPARHRRPAKTVQLRCERFEDKITPALFNVQAPISFGT